jgi:hypothetical protein
VPLGARLGATAAGSGPNNAWLIDAATARRSPSTKCPYTSLVTVMLACPNRAAIDLAADCPARARSLKTALTGVACAIGAR